MGDRNDLATRKHDGAYVVVVALTHPAVKLYEAGSANARAAKIFGKVEEQTIGVVPHPVDDRRKSHWASNIQPSAVSLYLGKYIVSRQLGNSRFLGRIRCVSHSPARAAEELQ